MTNWHFTLCLSFSQRLFNFKYKFNIKQDPDIVFLCKCVCNFKVQSLKRKKLFELHFLSKILT